MGNLMEMNDESFFSQFSSDDLVPQSTVKKQCKKIWDEYFQSKSLIGKAQLFVRLFRKKEMTPVLELLGVDNKKNSGDNVNRTIVENLQDALNDINNSSRGADLSSAHRALMTTLSSRRLTQRKKSTC